MSNWPVVAGPGLVPLLGYAGASGGAVTTPSLGAPHVKGAWTEVTPATPVDVVALHLTLNSGSGSGNRFLVDVGIGVAGDERVLVPNVWWSTAGYRNSVPSLRLPVAIPQGSRISVAVQSGGTGANTQLDVHAAIVPAHPLLPPGLRCLGCYGADPATTTLTSATQGYGVLNWAEVVAATPARVRAIVAQYGGGAVGSSFTLGGTYHVGQGAAGAETLLLSAFPWRTFSGDAFGTLHPGPHLVDVPAGTRLSVAVNGNNVANVHQLGLLLFG